MNSQRPLTPKQNRVLSFIKAFSKERGWAPTLREIGAFLGVSVGSAQDIVDALKAKGAITRTAASARSMRPVETEPTGIPLLGAVFAGSLHAALEHPEKVLPADGRNPGRCFALRVRGDSMRDAGILDGDLVIVGVGQIPGDGDIVVARVEDEATVKRLRMGPGSPWLEAANPDYAPIVGVPFNVVGVVVEVRRIYGGQG